MTLPTKCESGGQLLFETLKFKHEKSIIGKYAQSDDNRIFETLVHNGKTESMIL